MMAPELKVFDACNAFLGVVTTKKECQVWLDKSTLHVQNLLYPVDVGRTPSADWSNAIVDDFVHPRNIELRSGVTSIGPEWPPAARDRGDAHATEGAIYVLTTERERIQKLNPNPLPYWPPIQGEAPYRWQTHVWRDDDRSFRRYFGFLAERRSYDPETGDATLDVFMATDVDLANPVTIGLNVNNPMECEPFDPSSWTTSGPRKPAGPVWLRWKFANDKRLTSPKLPIGLDLPEHGPRLREEPISVAQRCSALKSSHLDVPWYRHQRTVSISHDQPDYELGKIHCLMKRRIEVVDERWGLEAFLHLIDSDPAVAGKFETLDLVAHATAVSHALSFDGWQLMADQELGAFCERVRGPMRKFKQLRLIGCATAAGAGCEAIDYMTRAFGIEVVGTTSTVYAANFLSGVYDGQGLKAWQALAYRPAIPAEARDTFPPTLDDLVAATTAPLLDPRGIRLDLDMPPVGFLETMIESPSASRLPGLLTLPLLELAFHGQDGRGLVAEVLFEFEWLRIRGGAFDGLIYRIRDPEHFAELVTRANMDKVKRALQLA